MSRRQLLMEKVILDASMPGIGGPLGILGAGTGVTIYGALLFPFWALGGPGFAAMVPSIVLSAAVFSVGAIGVILGIVWLLSRVEDRKPIYARMQAIDVRLDDPRRWGESPPEDGPPPTPPPAIVDAQEKCPGTTAQEKCPPAAC